MLIYDFLFHYVTVGQQQQRIYNHIISLISQFIIVRSLESLIFIFNLFNIKLEHILSQPHGLYHINSTQNQNQLHSTLLQSISTFHHQSIIARSSNQLMQHSSSFSTKSYNAIAEGLFDPEKNASSAVNWVSVINFLENQYAKSSLFEKQWFLQKKLLNEEIIKLKSQLSAVQSLNINLSNRIRLLECALRKEKLTKGINPSDQQQKNYQKAKTLETIEKYFQKNGWSLKQQAQNFQQNIHKRFLKKVLEEVGVNFSSIDKKYKKTPLYSDNVQQIEKIEKTQSFKTLINDLSKIKISSTTKINAHLDSVRGLYVQKGSLNQNTLATVSEDCLLKLWNVEIKSQQSKQAVIEPIISLREHTGQLFALDGGSIKQTSQDLVLFTGGSQEFVKVWYAPFKENLNNLKCIGGFLNDQKHQTMEQLEEYNQIIWCLKYKSKKLLTSSSDGVIRLFKTQIQSLQNRFSAKIELLNSYFQKNYFQTVVEWVGQRGFLSGCSNFPRIYLWDVQTGRAVQKYSYEVDKPKEDKGNQKKQQNVNSMYQANALKYISDNKVIYAGCEDKTIRVFSFQETKMVKKIDAGINDSISCLQFYKGNYIIAGCQNGGMKIWDRRTYRLMVDNTFHQPKYDEGILCLRCSEDYIFSGGADGIINVVGF